MTEKGRRLCNDVIVPLLKQEETAIAEMGEAEGRALIHLLELYGTTYCEHIRQIIYT